MPITGSSQREEICQRDHRPLQVRCKLERRGCGHLYGSHGSNLRSRTHSTPPLLLPLSAHYQQGQHIAYYAAVNLPEVGNVSHHIEFCRMCHLQSTVHRFFADFLLPLLRAPYFLSNFKGRFPRLSI